MPPPSMVFWTLLSCCGKIFKQIQNFQCFADKLQKRPRKEKSWKVTWPETTFEVTGTKETK